MWSIWFYFMPNGTAFEAIGFNSAEEAVEAFDEKNWFMDEAENPIYINNNLKNTAVVKICRTNKE